MSTTTPASPNDSPPNPSEHRGSRGPGSSSPRLASLLRRVAEKDEQAFAELYDATAGLLFAVITRTVRDVALSEEVLQEVCVEIWRHAAQFDPARGSARTWLTTIAHRRAVDTVRSVQASRRRDSDEAEYQLAERVVDVQEEGIRRVESERMAHVLGSLSAPQRQAIALAYFGGYTQQEIADLLDIPLGTVKTRIREGMIVLRDRMGVST